LIKLHEFENLFHIQLTATAYFILQYSIQTICRCIGRSCEW